MEQTAIACRLNERRNRLFGNPKWNGLDFLEVSDDQQSLCVHFFGAVPENISPENIRVEGGRRIRGLRATKVEIDRSGDPEIDDCLRITIDKPGDFSTYRVCLVEKNGGTLAGIDPRYACLDFNFKVSCPSDLDCKQVQIFPPEVLPAPDINYLAKDYESFRQLIYDRLALTAPQWQERHAPDLAVALVELLAYTADYLSYYQDAVGTEAYLDTARQRISVRRHARLVDYRMHDGCNARAWVCLSTKSDLALPGGRFYFITGFPELTGQVLNEADLAAFSATQYEVFEPILADGAADVWIYAAQSTMHFYTWGDSECCLPIGATRATLIHEAAPVAPGSTPHGDALNLLNNLKVGDVVIFEEVLGPTTGTPADADPTHRHAVRLIHVESKVDALFDNLPLVEIEWAPEDALPFSLCLSVRLPAPDCTRLENVSVARGNVILVDHGKTLSEPVGPVEPSEVVGECECEGTVIQTTVTPAEFRPTLKNAPLTFSAPVPHKASAGETIRQDVREALPQVLLQETSLRAQAGRETSTSPGDGDWVPRYDLLESTGEDRHFVVEMDDEGLAHLRFGDSDLGRQSEAGTLFRAKYRVGNGPAGNVGRDTIDRLVFRDSLISASLQPRNPLPATGGTSPEPIAEVKLLAPGAFRKKLERAITADDYADLADDDPKLQRASADFAWTGSWYEARVAIDPLHTEEADAALLAEVDARLEQYRRLGHDLAVVPAQSVPIDLELEICVLPHHTRGHVKAALLDVFSNRTLPNGELGFFHPDKLTFGVGIDVSVLVTTAMAVEGVETVRVNRLQRMDGTGADAKDKGVLAIGGSEIAQLDNDPNFLENGRLKLIVRGGR